MRDDPSVVALVARAADGDQRAWNELVDRYAPLVWSTCNRYQLNRHDIDDVGQNVWLLLVEQLGNLRQPAALPGWLATTTQRECLKVLRATRRYDHPELIPDDQLPPDPDAALIEQEIIVAERNAALHAAFAELPLRSRQLMSMLVSDPPYSYLQISAALQIPIGSIGPQRARCLARLRRSRSLTALIDGEIEDTHVNNAGGEPRG
jgi:RNA polymerase sigma factor (sigma-70 family)